MSSNTIHEVKKQHTQELMAIEGVQSVGIGNNAQGQVAIIIGLDKSRPEIQAKLPTELDGYPVEVRIIGSIEAQ